MSRSIAVRIIEGYAELMDRAHDGAVMKHMQAVACLVEQAEEHQDEEHQDEKSADNWEELLQRLVEEKGMVFDQSGSNVERIVRAIDNPRINTPIIKAAQRWGRVCAKIMHLDEDLDGDSDRIELAVIKCIEYAYGRDREDDARRVLDQIVLKLQGGGIIGDGIGQAGYANILQCIDKAMFWKHKYQDQQREITDKDARIMGLETRVKEFEADKRRYDNDNKGALRQAKNFAERKVMELGSQLSDLQQKLIRDTDVYERRIKELKTELTDPQRISHRDDADRARAWDLLVDKLAISDPSVKSPTTRDATVERILEMTKRSQPPFAASMYKLHKELIKRGSCQKGKSYTWDQIVSFAADSVRYDNILQHKDQWLQAVSAVTAVLSPKGQLGAKAMLPDEWRDTVLEIIAHWREYCNTNAYRCLSDLSLAVTACDGTTWNVSSYPALIQHVAKLLQMRQSATDDQHSWQQFVKLMEDRKINAEDACEDAIQCVDDWIEVYQWSRKNGFDKIRIPNEDNPALGEQLVKWLEAKLIGGYQYERVRCEELVRSHLGPHIGYKLFRHQYDALIKEVRQDDAAGSMESGAPQRTPPETTSPDVSAAP